MRAVVQRVEKASVETDGRIVSSIGRGILVFIGITSDDSERDMQYIVDKTLNLRIFEDEQGIMNRSLLEEDLEALVVSQFTLYGDTRKGRRPSYNRAGNPDDARKLFSRLEEYYLQTWDKVAFGEFQAMMKVDLVNDGPVTLLVDSRKEF